MNDKSYYILLESILNNILHLADSPGKFAAYLSEEIRSVIGVKIVSIVYYNEYTQESELIGICPARKFDFLNNPQLTKLVRINMNRKETGYVDLSNAAGEEAEVLQHYGFKDYLIIPLSVGNKPEGQIFLFDLYEKARIQRVIEILNQLSGLCATILKNTKMFQNLERIVESRTAELEEKNQRLEVSEGLLKKQNEEYAFLNKQLNEINKELIAAKDKAFESDKLKTAFLQNMSHEIRTPMNAIMGFSELLVKQFDNKEKLQHYTNIIHHRCSDLLQLINEILDIAKIESGQIPVDYQECNLLLLFEELEAFFNGYRDKINKGHVEFSIMLPDSTGEMVLRTDIIKLKQILINLISNAFKFTDSGKITAGCHLPENGKLEFFVSDTGIGIPEDKHDFIFERFSQVHVGDTRSYGGTGLGLSIVKGLVELLGGTIRVKSEPGKGSLFTFDVHDDTL